MITFRQKEFFAPLAMAGNALKWLGTAKGIGTSTAVLGIGGMYQSHRQGKKSLKLAEEQGKEQADIMKEQGKEQARLMEEQNERLKALEKAAKKNPEVVSGGVSDILQQSTYSATAGIGKFAKTAWQAGKGAFGEGVKGNMRMAAGGAAGTYVVGKVIHRNMKKEGLDVDERGNLIQKQKSYGIVPAAVSNLGSKVAKTKVGKFWKKHHVGSYAIGAGFSAPAAILGYRADKQQFKDQQAATAPREDEEDTGKQKSYSILTPVVGGFQSVAKGFRTFKSHPGRTITGFLNKAGSFNTIGTKEIQSFGQKAIEHGKKNNSKAAQRMGEWITKKDANGKLVNATKANLIAIPATAAIGTGSYQAIESGLNKVGGKVDPGAYKYQKAKEAAV